MDIAVFLTFVAATVTLALIPGPNMALIVSTSIAHGTRCGLLALVGTTAALVVQLLLVGVGLSAVLATAGRWFDILRWIGAVYLIYLGLRMWRSAPPEIADGDGAPKPGVRLVLQGLVVSLSNPKTLLFFGAFFPQFISGDRSLAVQLAILSVTFVTVVATLDGIWAVLAGRMRGWIARRGRLLNRVSGGLLVGAGAGLALVRPR